MQLRLLKAADLKSPNPIVTSQRLGWSQRRSGTSVLSRLTRSERAVGTLFSAPAFAFFALFWIFPFGLAVYYSFTNYDLLTAPRWIGTQNYSTLFSSATFIHSLGITALFIVVTVVPTLVLALLLAAPISRGGRVFGVYRALIMIPAVMPLVASAIVWLIIYQPNGFMNTVIGYFGISPVPWLTGIDQAFWALTLMTIWKYLGFYFLIILTGLQTVPRNLYDAAAIDGASSSRAFLWVTVPLIRRTLAFVAVIGLIVAAQSFVPAYLLTGGGPANATNLLPVYLYKVGFTFSTMGAAAAISVVMTVALVAVAFIQFRIIQGKAVHGTR
jgi:multiple sugar transport system permease protein